MCPDRLGIERVQEVSSECGLCVFDHNKVRSDFEERNNLDFCTLAKASGIFSSSFYFAYLFSDTKLLGGMLCSNTTNVE